MIYLALSCLQGRPMQAAAEELLALEPDGLQLTAGNIPMDGFFEWVTNHTHCCTHHGFSWTRLRERVWQTNGQLAGYWQSVHPPKHKDQIIFCAAPYKDVAYETMYPGYYLGTGDEIESAMKADLRLAVDISHVFIQLQQGAMQPETWRRLQEYDNIAEIHVSANAGKQDTHFPCSEDTFGLEWAKERSEVKVLECYMHRLSLDDRKRQMELLR